MAHALSGALDEALALREEVAFLQAAHISLGKNQGTGEGSYSAREPAVQQLMDQAVQSLEVADILASSALCPWREERLFEGARYALDSLVELWAVEEQEGRGGR